MQNRIHKELQRCLPEVTDGPVTVWPLVNEHLLHVRHPDDAKQEAWLFLGHTPAPIGRRLAQAVKALANPAAPLQLWHLYDDGGSNDPASRGLVAAPKHGEPSRPLRRVSFWNAISACDPDARRFPCLVVDDTTRDMITLWQTKVHPAPTNASHPETGTLDGLVPFEFKPAKAVLSYVEERVFELMHLRRDHPSAPASLTIQEAVAQALKSDRSWLSAAD